MHLILRAAIVVFGLTVSGLCGENLLEIVARMPQGDILFTFGNRDYLQFHLHWICNTMPWHGVHERTLIVTDDRESVDAIRTLSSRVNVLLAATASRAHGFYSKGYRKLTIRRVSILVDILRTGRGVIMFETDAVWTRNILKDPNLTNPGRPHDLALYRDGSRGELIGAGFMSMKGGRGPAFDIWSRVLQRLQEDMEQFEREMDSFEIIPDEHSVKHEQDIFLEILAEMTSAKQITSLDLDRCVYSSGLWYEFRSNHTARCGETPPSVLNNNWIQGNGHKIDRAKAYSHWFLSNEREFASSQHCVPDWSAAISATRASFRTEIPPGRESPFSWTQFPITAEEIGHLESEFEATESFGEKMSLNGRNRSPSLPFITGDAFRLLCPFRCEDQFECAFSYNEVQPGDCIYIAMTDLRTLQATDKYLRAYREILPKIRSPHIVVTHNGDLSTPDDNDGHVNEGEVWSTEFSPLLNFPTLVGWFASNCKWKGGGPKPQKLHCIPIGVANRYNQGGSTPQAYFEWMRKRHLQKPSKLFLAAFNYSRNETLASSALSSLNASWITRVQYSVAEQEPNRDDYVRLLQDHHFVACPPGHGHGTHRLWEVLLAGSIPVVMTTPMDSMYSDLPILIVKDWAHVTITLLKNTLEDFRTRRWNTKKIFFRWWRELLTNMSMLSHAVASSGPSFEGISQRMLKKESPVRGLQHPCSGLYDYLGSARCLMSTIQATRVRNRIQGRMLPGDRSFLVVMMGNKAFIPFIQNWLCNTAHMDGVHERTLLLFTDHGYQALQSTGFRVAYVGCVGANLTQELSQDMNYGTYGYWRLVQLRVQAVATLLRSGVPFLLCEPDALWVQSPLLDPALHASFEIVYFSDNAEIPGFGFIRLWPTERIVSLFSDLESRFAMQMPSSETDAIKEIKITPEQDILHTLLRSRGFYGSIASRLQHTKYVSGTWYAQEPIRFKTGGKWLEIHGSEVRKSCKADGIPYVINHNWIVGNKAKILRAKTWGHWFIQNESSGTCDNTSLLQRQIADMFGTMRSLAPVPVQYSTDRVRAGGLMAGLVWSSIPSIIFFLLHRHGGRSLPSWATLTAMTLILVTMLIFAGLLDAEFGDTHSDASRRRRFGISLFVSGEDDLASAPGVVALSAGAIMLGKSYCKFKGHPLSPFRQMGIEQRGCAIAFVTVVLLFALMFDAEVGDTHSDRLRRKPVGLTFYITFSVPLLTALHVEHYVLCTFAFWSCIVICRRKIYRRVFRLLSPKQKSIRQHDIDRPKLQSSPAG